LVRGERDVRRLFDAVVLMITVCAFYGLCQYFLTDYGELHKRIVGPFSHYQTFAGILLIGDLLLLARLVSGDGWKKPRTYLALAAINTTLLLTLTRGAWVAVTLTFAAYVLVRARRYFVVYAAAALLVVLLVPTSWERIRSIAELRDESNYDRLCMIDAGFYMVCERPLLGVGPGMVARRYPIYRHPTAPRFTVPHLHNTFLELIAERGLLSLAAYLWLMAAGFAVALGAYRREGGPRGERAELYVGVILVLLGFNLAGLFEDNWRDTEVQRLILFLLAAPLCLTAGGETRDEE
jgi:O-antigen ligase